MTENTATRHAASATDIALGEKLRHVSWGSILLGLAIAIAIQILLGLLGIGLGFAIVDPVDPMGGIGAWSVATSVYLVISQIIALFIGGYVASHLAPSLTDRTAMLHGLAIWALATIAMLWLGTTVVGSAVSGAGKAVSGIASATGQAIEAAVPDGLSLPDIDMADLPEPVRRTLQEHGVTPANLRDELWGAFRDVVSPREERRVMAELRRAAQSALARPTEAAAIIERALDNVFGANGILGRDDLGQMRTALQQRLELSDREVEEIMTRVEQGIGEARQTMSQTINEAQKTALEAADTVTDRIGSIALWLFLASVLGLIAAVIGGRLGEARVRTRT